MTLGRILYEDPRIIIVDKASNTIVHGCRSDSRTLLEIVRLHLESQTGSTPPFLAPANRLDRNTCGPVVFAKDREMAMELRRLFTQCRVTKTYSACLRGRLMEPLCIEADIIRGSHKRVTVENLSCSHPPFPDKANWFANRAANSSTISATLIVPVASTDETTLVDVEPWTGRHHQIRAVCEAIGYPICGDKKYARVKGLKRQKSVRGVWTVQALVCRQLEIAELGLTVTSGFLLQV